MADQKLTALLISNPIDLDPGDLIYGVEDTGATPASGGAKVSQLMFNRYKITPSVSGNNLTVALKHEDGTDPSTDRPLYFKIGDTLRSVTAALSVTKAAATNWANMGSAELATKEVDLFPYLIWNTNLTPDAVDILWSRIPYANLYSDFSATTTNEKYAAINATAPASTDSCVNVGRFAATLSAGAGYTWTVPTFTSANLTQRPTFETRILSWTPVWTNLTVGAATLTYWYQRVGRRIRGGVEVVFAADTTIGGSTAHTLPFSRSSSYGATANFPNYICRLFDASAAPAFQGISTMSVASIITIVAQDATGAYIKQVNLTANTPFTWTTSDQIAYEFDYLAD